MLASKLGLLSWACLALRSVAVDPAAVYDGGYNDKDAPISLKIGNGGAGQSGLVKVLADAFIQDSVANKSKPFKVAWYKSDTTESINYLKAGVVDVGITYTEPAEQVAVEAGIATSPIYYLFRDHFLIVGPKANPAKISNESDIKTVFSQLFASAEAGNTDPPTRFLSRYDKSATNIKEEALWISIGQVPWATKYSTWYHQYIAYPIQSLTAAILLQEYTLTDRGTILSLDPSVAKNTVIYKAATDDESDPLLNPAHLLIGAKAENNETAQAFADWATSDRGQDVITSFKKNGVQLYSAAPKNKTIPSSKLLESFSKTRAKPLPDQPQQRIITHIRQEEWKTVVKSQPTATNVPESQAKAWDL